MIADYPRPDWTFTPASSIDFSERSKNVAHLLGQPLQTTQEWLARVFGFEHLHALQAQMKRLESDPASIHAGPFVGSMDLVWMRMRDPEGVEAMNAAGIKVPDDAARDNYLLRATQEFVADRLENTNSVIGLEAKYWEIREIELFGPIEAHRAAYAQARDKWRVIEGTSKELSDARPEDYATLHRRESGRLVLELTNSGKAILDALQELRYRVEDNPPSGADVDRDTWRRLRGNEIFDITCRIARDHPQNPWGWGFVVAPLLDVGMVTEALHYAKRAMKLLDELHDGQLKLALPGKDGQDHIAAGDARLERFVTGGLDGGQSMIEHRTQHLDELAVAIGVLLQLGAHLGQARW